MQIQYMSSHMEFKHGRRDQAKVSAVAVRVMRPVRVLPVQGVRLQGRIKVRRLSSSLSVHLFTLSDVKITESSLKSLAT